MPCYHPQSAYRSYDVSVKTQKRVVRFVKNGGEILPQFGEPLKLPCGRCRGCRHEYRRQWAVRICHEAQLYGGKNCFLTLTFDDKKHQYNSTLKKTDFQKFMKRFRKFYFGNQKSDVRYFHCGEYGEKLGRPHHHAILFNHQFEDLKHWQDKDGSKYYRSKILEKLWPMGNSVVGEVNYSTASYVAGYVLKKINGAMAPDHYQGRIPEYTTMSRRPGIAREWYEKYKNTDVFPRDFIVLNGTKSKVPKYYNKCYELTNPDEYGKLRDMRIAKAKVNPNNHPDRLKAAEQIQIARDSQIKRKYEKHDF